MHEKDSKSSHIQTLMFDKDIFTPAHAKTWAKKHGHYSTPVDTGGPDARYLRIRQVDPDQFTRLRTIELTDGVMATVGPLNRRRKNPPAQRFSDIRYVSGQEPRSDDARRGEGVATTLEVKFTVAGKEAAQLLGVQQRVLKSVLRDLTKTQAIGALTSSKAGDAILRSFKDDAKRYIEGDINDVANTPGLFHLSNFQIDWDLEQQDYWQVSVYPDSLSVVFDAEVNAWGDWRS